MQKLPSWLILTGFLILILSIIIGWYGGPALIESQVIRLANLQNNTFIWEKWKNPTNQMFLRVYFFNVTNPGEVETGEIPVFKEIGPYTYRESRYKEHIIYHEDKDTVSYRQPVTYHFTAELSGDDLSDMDVLTTINIPLVGISSKLSSYSSMIRFMAGSFLGQYDQSLFVRKMVKEMLFDGYYSEMVDELQGLTGDEVFVGGMVGVLVGVSFGFGVSICLIFVCPEMRLKRNATDEGLYEVHSGIKDSSKFGSMYSYNSQTSLPAWSSPPCNMLNGSDGSILPPLLTKTSIIRGFHHDVCRSLYMTYVKEIEYKGIPGLRFEAPEEQWRNGGRNLCFCEGGESEGEEDCFEDGVYSGRGCHRDGPITISNPHFLYAPFYLNLTSGLSPDIEKHGLFVEVEPTSGLILHASRKMQVNIDLKPNLAIKVMRNAPMMQFPVLWVDESFSLDQEVYDKLLYYLLLAMKMLNIGKWVSLVGSFVMIAIAVGINVVRARRKDYLYG